MAPRLSEWVQPDVTYYGIVRSTLTAIDGQKLSASINGTAIPLTILVGAATISNYFSCMYGYILGAYLCFIAALVAGTFLLKINLLNHFIKESVGVALEIEDILLIGGDIRLTKRFEKHAKAGARGDRLFMAAVFLILATALGGLGVEVTAISNKTPCKGGSGEREIKKVQAAPVLHFASEFRDKGSSLKQSVP